MFVVFLSGGTKLIEGKDVDDWASVPDDAQITGVGLTDGIHLFDHLAGFEQYVVCVEAFSSIPMGPEASGTLKQRKIAQTLYGIKGKRVNRGMISRAVNKARDQVLDKFAVELDPQRTVEVGQNVMAVKMGHALANRFDRAIKQMFREMDDAEVVEVRLAPTVKFLARPELPQDAEGLRSGIVQEELTEATVEDVVYNHLLGGILDGTQ